MSNPNDVVLLFRRKAEQWERESSVQRHLTDLGIEGIAMELSSERGFEAVCELLKERGEFGLRVVIEQSIMGYVNVAMGVPFNGLLDFLLEACEVACSSGGAGHRGPQSQFCAF